MTSNGGMFLALFLTFGTVPVVRTIGFGDIPGDYCKYRSPQCCVSRDDDCTAPILGNHLCYCDRFCGQHPGHDCCPDYAEVCEGGPPRQSHDDFGADCIDNAGVRHGRGQRYKYNCQHCTCGSGCDGTPCVINTDLLQKVNDGRYSWRGQNYSEFWGQSLDDGVKYRLGTLYPERSVQNMNEILLEERPQLPAHFDAREKWPSFIHPIRDQKNCGASWAFSTTAVSADRLAIQSEGKSDAILSTQQLISCNQLKQKGCTGGYLDRAWWYIHKLGVVSESCYPYESGWTNQIGECKIPKDEYRTAENTSCPSGSRDSKIYKTTPTYRISSRQEDIQSEIFTNGPVQATFLVHEDFYMYSGGVYQHLDLARDLPPGNRKSAYHSVRIIGWGVDTSTGRPLKYWLCDNSWGTEWGEDGFFRILRGENHCEIESFVLAAWGRGSKRRKAYLTKKVRKLFKF